MFKQPEIGLQNFSEQIHNIPSSFIFSPLKAVCFAYFLQLLFPSNSPENTNNSKDLSRILG